MSLARLLLRAIFLDGRESMDAWHAWQATTQLDDVDPECYALLPMLYRKLERVDPDHPDLGRLKGVRRRIWLENQLVLPQAAAALRRLHSEGIESLLLGELAMGTAYYPENGLRQIRQTDIAVPRGDARRTKALLSPMASTLRVHTSIMFLGCPREVEHLWWSEAAHVHIMDVPSRVLAPADQLVHTLVSAGSLWSSDPATWWMADALILLAESNVDINRVVDIARRLKVTAFLLDALERLRAALGCPVALNLIDALRTAPTSLADRLELGYSINSRWQRPLLSWFIAPPRRFYRSYT
ncbi:MAG: nucleotidyltransferase family protein [Gemmatimonadota bacterium]